MRKRTRRDWIEEAICERIGQILAQYYDGRTPPIGNSQEDSLQELMDQMAEQEAEIQNVIYKEAFLDGLRLGMRAGSRKKKGKGRK